MSIINAMTARNNFFKLIDEVIETDEPTFITSENGNVVVLSEEGYKAIQEKLYLKVLEEKIEDEIDMKIIKEYEEDVKNGNVELYTHSEVMKILVNIGILCYSL